MVPKVVERNNPSAAQPQKPPLSYEELRDIIDLSLWAGQLLLQHGAETDRIEETVHRIGTALGCDWMDVLVSPNALVVTATSHGEFRTKTRRVVALGLNMNVVAEVSSLSRRVEDGLCDRSQIRSELERIGKARRLYNRWLVVAAAALSCAAFSRIFGGDWNVFAVTLTASAIAMVVRQELQRQHFNPLVIVVGTAFTAGLIASSADIFDLSPQPQIAIVASSLMLVPGVQLINAVEDLIKGHVVTAIVRATLGTLILSGIALGLLLALAVTGAQL
ncbi:threonine/serine exporter family protein [Candidatus Gracilibacteria bacterium]|nr:threonine/serine exporter family protein [Candidatus Gracilibacteria bacterium]